MQICHPIRHEDDATTLESYTQGITSIIMSVKYKSDSGSSITWLWAKVLHKHQL